MLEDTSEDSHDNNNYEDRNLNVETSDDNENCENASFFYNAILE